MAELNNKRIAKNATMLMIRMIITSLIGLLSSRIILNALGVADYGVYGVVGGVTGMFSFLTTTMSGATSRFITFELGQGNEDRIKKTFSTTVVVHLILGGIILLLAETIGVWFLNAKLNIPNDRMFAANILLQISIIGSVLSVWQVPYNALVISYERMSVYAYVEVLASVLKLVIAFAIMYSSNVDRLILYSLLLLCSSILQISIYRVYCLKQFTISRFHWIWDKSILFPIVKFAGLDMYGNMCSLFSYQGRNMLINIFFGVVCNAAVSVASTVQGVLMQLTSSIIQAFRPQIIKQYAVGNIAQMQQLMHRAMIFVVVSLSMLSIPIMLHSHYVINLWLGQVPTNAEIFLQLLLVHAIFSVYNNVCNIAIHATGRIQYVSFIGGTISLFSLAAIWIGFKCGSEASLSFWVFIYTVIVTICVAYFIIKKLIPQISIRKMIFMSVKMFFLMVLGYLIVYYITNLLPSTFVSLIVTCILSVVIVGTLSWLFLFDSQMKNQIKLFVSTRILGIVSSK